LTLSALHRNETKTALTEAPFDLIVIGGGITGAGILLDAATRGLKVCMLEKHDFAYGTSSRSTKLIHGGLRYLKQLEFGLVHEVGSERAVVHKIAPHLVLPEKMLLPLSGGKSTGYWLTSFGLSVYDWLAGVRKEDRRMMLTRPQTIKAEPLLNTKGIIGGALYTEYRTDDARLTIEIIKTACDHGAVALNYAEVKGFINEHGNVQGVECVDGLSGNVFQVKGRVVVNATGPWVDQLRLKDGSLEGKRLHLTKGVHIVVDHQHVPVRQAVYFEGPDGRMVFAIPRDGKTYIGTTDTDYAGNPEAVVTKSEDVEYLLKAVAHAFAVSSVSIQEVESTWAGLRPLIHEDGKSASELSRKDEIFESPSGLLSIAGGKLTGYRKMAERVVDQVVEKISNEGENVFGDCVTDRLPLSVSYPDLENFFQAKESFLNNPEFIAQKNLAHRLMHTYGMSSQKILDQSRSLGSSDPATALLEAEVIHCIVSESVEKLSDFYVRRTGLLYFDLPKVAATLDGVLKVFSEQLNWGEDRIQKERSELTGLINDALFGTS